MSIAISASRRPSLLTICASSVSCRKCDLNSLLFLLTPAGSEQKLNTLVAKLVKFKNLWDRDAPLQDVLPTVFAANRGRYRGYTVRQVCEDAQQLPLRRRQGAAAPVLPLRELFPEPAISSKQAYEALVANNVDYVPLSEAAGGASRRRWR